MSPKHPIFLYKGNRNFISDFNYNFFRVANVAYILLDIRLVRCQGIEPWVFYLFTNRISPRRSIKCLNSKLHCIWCSAEDSNLSSLQRLVTKFGPKYLSSTRALTLGYTAKNGALESYASYLCFRFIAPSYQHSPKVSGSGRWIRTTDLQLMRLPSYQLLHPAITL